MPTKRKELNIETRSAIVTLRKEGHTIREIAKKVKIPQSTVGYTLKRFDQTGGNSSRKRRGRPKVTTRAEDKYIVLVSKRDRFKTAPQIQAEVNRNRMNPISYETVRRRLCNAGLNGRVAARKPLLRHPNKVKRL